MWSLVNTGWRRFIGCLNLQVIFCKRATNNRALLRKMTHEDKASYDSTPPCMYIYTSWFFFGVKSLLHMYICLLNMCVGINVWMQYAHGNKCIHVCSLHIFPFTWGLIWILWGILHMCLYTREYVYFGLFWICTDEFCTCVCVFGIYKSGNMCMQYVYVIVFLGEEPVQYVYTCMFV